MREETNGLRVRLSSILSWLSCFSCLIQRKWKKENSATDFICDMRQAIKGEAYSWMVEEEANERFDEISIGGRES